MISDYPDQTLPSTPLEKSKGEEKPRGLPSDKWTTRPPIQTRIIRWIVSQGLSQGAAETLAVSFYDMILQKAKKEGQRQASVTYDVGYEHEYIKITVSKDKKHDPEQLLADYIFGREIKGNWAIKKRSKIGNKFVYQCTPTAKTSPKKGRTEAAMRSIDKLSPRQAQTMLKALQDMLASQKRA